MLENMLKKIGLVGLLVVSSFTAQAFVIDNFNGGAGSVSAAAAGSDSDLSVSCTVPGFPGPSPSCLGGVRTLDIPGATAVSGIGALTMTANPATSGLLSFSLDALTSGSAKLTWTDLSGVDLTDAGASTFFTFDILSIDQGNVDLTITAEDTSATSASNTILGAGLGNVQSPFTDYPGVDFTSIKTIMLEINGRDGSDLTLDQLFSSHEIVPFSMNTLSFAVSLLALLTSRKRFAKQ